MFLNRAWKIPSGACQAGHRLWATHQQVQPASARLWKVPAASVRLNLASSFAFVFSHKPCSASLGCPSMDSKHLQARALEMGRPPLHGMQEA